MSDTRLKGDQLKRVYAALIDAFPTPVDLAKLVRFELDENLAAISVGNLSDSVFHLLEWTESRDLTALLLAQAGRAKPDNPCLADVIDELARSLATYAVLVGVVRDAQFTPRGGGFLLCATGVLTARSVVCDRDGTALVGLAVRHANGTLSTGCELRWSGAGDVDVALLEVNLDGAESGDRSGLLGMRDILQGERWNAHAVPELRRSVGVTRACHAERSLVLVEVNPKSLRDALVGAAVVIGPRVVGVVSGGVPGSAGTLSATSVAAFARDPAFVDALKVRPRRPNADVRVQKVEEEVVELLGKRPSVAERLACHLGITPSAGAVALSVARELVHARKASEAITALNYADDETADGSEGAADRVVLRAVLWQALPCAVDRRALVDGARAAIARGASAVELPLRTDTWAEIIVAGVDQRACRFAMLREAEMPAGEGRVRMPAATYAPLLLNKPERFVELVVEKLADELPVGGSQRGSPKDERDAKDKRDAVEAKLAHRGYRAPPKKRLPYYLLFEGAAHGDAPGGDTIWTLARDALKDALPSLRLVRLTGGSFGDELEVVEHLRDILGRRP